jgi:hypothetical protein
MIGGKPYIKVPLVGLVHRQITQQENTKTNILKSTAMEKWLKNFPRFAHDTSDQPDVRSEQLCCGTIF